MMGLPMRPRLPLALGLVALGLAVAGCGAVESLKDAETATEAQAAEAAPPEETAAVMAEEPPAETVVETAPAETAEEAPAETAEEAPPADNAGAWSEIDAGAQRFASKLDAATQAIASCQTEAAAGEDFTECQGAAFEAIATAGDELIAIVDAAAPRADGDCRAALETLRASTAEMSADHRTAVGMSDLTSLETAYAEIAADLSAYADAAMTAGSSCAG
jgi:light-harvesting protein B-800-850 alpha chain